LPAWYTQRQHQSKVLADIEYVFTRGNPNTIATSLLDQTVGLKSLSA